MKIVAYLEATRWTFFFPKKIYSGKVSYIFFIKVFLIFREMELSSPKIKKFLMFQEMELFKETSCISGEKLLGLKNTKTHSEKISYILGIELSCTKLKKTLLLFLKKRFLYFRRKLGKPEKQEFFIFL